MSFSSSVARLLDSVAAAILLNQMVFRQNQVGERKFFAVRRLYAEPDADAMSADHAGEHGYTTCRSREWDMGLNQREEKAALKRLKRLNLLHEHREKSSGTVFYRVDLQRLKQLVLDAKGKGHSTRYQYFALTFRRDDAEYSSEKQSSSPRDYSAPGSVNDTFELR
jgi:hypothetical protein